MRCPITSVVSVTTTKAAGSLRRTICFKVASSRKFLTAEDGHPAVDLIEDPPGDLLPSGRDDEDRLPLTQSRDHKVHDLRGDIKVDERIEGVLKGEEQGRRRQHQDVEGEPGRPQTNGETLEEDHRQDVGPARRPQRLQDDSRPCSQDDAGQDGGQKLVLDRNDAKIHPGDSDGKDDRPGDAVEEEPAADEKPAGQKKRHIRDGVDQRDGENRRQIMEEECKTRHPAADETVGDQDPVDPHGGYYASHTQQKQVPADVLQDRPAAPLGNTLHFRSPPVDKLHCYFIDS
jgi:hypothetical protein